MIKYNKTSKEVIEWGENKVKMQLSCANFNPCDVGCVYGECKDCKDRKEI